MTQMRKIIAKRLLESKLTLPAILLQSTPCSDFKRKYTRALTFENEFQHSYMAIEIEMDNLMATRAKFNEQNNSKACSPLTPRPTPPSPSSCPP